MRVLLAIAVLNLVIFASCFLMGCDTEVNSNPTGPETIESQLMPVLSIPKELLEEEESEEAEADTD